MISRLSGRVSCASPAARRIVVAAACAFAVAMVSGCRRAPAPEDAPENRMIEEDKPAAPVAAAPPTAADTDDARKLRERLVRSIEVFDSPWGTDEGWDPRVLEAMRRIPRHLFVPQAGLIDAYRDLPYPIGHGQTISQPTVVALMTNALELRGHEKVLEIGTGSGYQTAVLSLLAREVYSIEIVPTLGNEAKARLAELGYRNVHVRVGDGYQGWPEHAPFDRVILTAAPPEMPQALVDQLAMGGIIVAPVGDGAQDLVRWRKQPDGLVKEFLGAVRFVPMVPGH
jgi:protein-L-isoaspartate(D-aspartate) O-methyltransferase